MPRARRKVNNQQFAHLRREVQSQEKEMIMLKNQFSETRKQRLALEVHCCMLEERLLIECNFFAKSFANLKSQKSIIETQVSVLREQLLEEREIWNKSIADLEEQFNKADKSVTLRIRDLEAKCLETDEALIDANKSTDLAAELIYDLSSENAAKESEICYLRAQIVQKVHSEAGKYAPKPMQCPPMVSNESIGSSIIADSFQAGLLNRAADEKQRYYLKMRQSRSKSPHPAGYQTKCGHNLSRYNKRREPRKQCFS